jgi:hypothetical protein
MKRIYSLIAIIVAILVLVTCRKNENSNSNQIEEITFSKDFNNSVSEVNIWFEFNFMSDNKYNNQEIAVRKEIHESYYRGYLLGVEIEKHEIYFKWVNISKEPLKFRLTAYITPPPIEGPHDEPEDTHDDTGGKGLSAQKPWAHLVPHPPPPPGGRGF